MPINIKNEVSLEYEPINATGSHDFYNKISIYTSKNNMGIEPVVNIKASLFYKEKVAAQIKAVSLKFIGSNPNSIDNADKYGCDQLKEAIMEVASDLDHILTKPLIDILDDESLFFNQLVLIKALKVKKDYLGFNFSKEIVKSFIHNAAGNNSLVMMKVSREGFDIQKLYWLDLGFKNIPFSNYLALSTLNQPWLNEYVKPRYKDTSTKEKKYKPLKLVRD